MDVGWGAEGTNEGDRGLMVGTEGTNEGAEGTDGGQRGLMRGAEGTNEGGQRGLMRGTEGTNGGGQGANGGGEIVSIFNISCKKRDRKRIFKD